jgi:hypothetical protein
MSLAAVCCCSVVAVAYDSPVLAMVAPSPPTQMLMLGRAALFGIVVTGSMLILAHAVHTGISTRTIVLASVLIVGATIGCTVATMSIRNYLQPPRCCGDYADSHWGYPYRWIWCMDVTYCGFEAGARYYWFALLADVIFWASAGIWAIGLLGYLPRWLHLSMTPEQGR